MMSLFVGIEKRLGDFHLQVSFEADNGITSLFGASGCGKSMTLKCIAGIVRPDRGKIILDGTTLYDSARHINIPAQKRQVGYLFQQYALFPNMTVTQNIRCGVRDRRRAESVLPDIIAQMHLEGLEKLYPAQLSGGQQQRVALARILVNEPKLLLLDEPFSALDSHLRFQLEQEVRQTLRRFGRTVLLVSHDRDEVFRLSGHIAVMHNGRIEKYGDKKEIFRDPGTKNGAILTGCKNISRIEKREKGSVFAVDWGMELRLDREVTDENYVGIRMHDVRPAEGTERFNVFRCRVDEEIENPFSYTLMLRCGGEAPSALGWETDKALWKGMRSKEVDICLPAEHIILLKG